MKTKRGSYVKTAEESLEADGLYLHKKEQIAHLSGDEEIDFIRGFDYDQVDYVFTIDRASLDDAINQLDPHTAGIMAPLHDALYKALDATSDGSITVELGI